MNSIEIGKKKQARQDAIKYYSQLKKNAKIEADKFYNAQKKRKSKSSTTTKKSLKK